MNACNICNGVLYNHKEEWNHILYGKMDTTGDHYGKQKKKKKRKKHTQKERCHIMCFVLFCFLKAEERVIGEGKGD